METLKNVTLTEVTKITEGEGKWGPWVLYGLKVDDEDWVKQQFRFMQSGKKPVPETGVKLESIEFEYNEQYDNYDIKKMLLPEKEKPKPKPRPQTINSNGKQSPFWFCLSYVKDLQVARIKRMPAEQFDTLTLMDFSKEIFEAGWKLFISYQAKEENNK